MAQMRAKHYDWATYGRDGHLIGRAAVTVRRPEDPAAAGGLIEAEVECHHARPPQGPGPTMLRRKRTCPDGCHRKGAKAILACHTMNPPDQEVACLAVRAHAGRYGPQGCSCDIPFWLTHGPEYVPCQGKPCWLPNGDQRPTEHDEEALALQGAVRDPWDHTA